jgi:hypothetical protein
MNIALKVLSWLSLGVILLAPFTVLAGWISLSALHAVLLAATVVWFSATPFWMFGSGGRGSCDT